MLPWLLVVLVGCAAKTEGPPHDGGDGPPAGDGGAGDELDGASGIDAAPDPLDRMELVSQPFDADPGWDASNNRSLQQCIEVTQAFGWSETGHAGGAPGELGGRIAQSVTPAWYGYEMDSTGWNERIAIDGRLALLDAHGEAFFGFFSSRGSGFRPANFIGLRLEGDGDGNDAAVELSYTTGLFESGAAVAGFRLAADPAVRTFVLQYLPDGGGGNGSIGISVDEQSHVFDLPAGVKDSPLELDRLGLVNVQKPGGQTMEVYFDDMYLTVDNSHHEFDADPGWDGSGHRASFTDCVQRGVQSFGWSDTNHAGGAAAGELGGLFWRVNPGDPATYYADATVAVDASMHLYAEGVVSAERAAIDSGILLGWFTVPPDFAARQSVPGFLGIKIEGPSSVGHYFHAVLYDEEDQRYLDEAGPVLVPDGADHAWSIRYDPDLARLWVRLDDAEQMFAVPPAFTDGVGPFDHFGVTAIRPDGQSIEIYFDDLVYTARPRP